MIIRWLRKILYRIKDPLKAPDQTMLLCAMLGSMEVYGMITTIRLVSKIFLPQIVSNLKTQLKGNPNAKNQKVN